ncbi:MAG: Adaptive-response sensory-kinase SasA [Myxococcota bacterium]|nr:Adaptive-response sensory-kinase SasA [Myxococcota bacterium]
MNSPVSRRNPLTGVHLDLYNKIWWLLFFRAVVASILLTVTLIVNFRSPSRMLHPAVNFLFIVIIFTYGATLVSLPFLQRVSNLRLLAWTQIGLDLMVATGLVYLTGGVESLFSFMYTLSIINGSIIFYRRGAYTTAIASMVLLCLLTWLQYNRFLPDLDAADFAVHQQPVDRLMFRIALNAGGFFFVAALAAYLAGLLREKGDQLTETRKDLAKLTTLHETIVASLPSGLLTLDSAGRVQYVNPAVSAMLGMHPLGLLNKSVDELFPHDPRAAGIITQLVRGERIHDGDGISYTRPDGGQRILAVQAIALAGPDPKSTGHLVVMSDETDLRAMQAQVMESQRLAAIGKLAAGIAHEIRNPLASVSGSIQLLRSNPGADEKQRRLMDIVVREVERLNKLITDFLRYARPPALDKKPCELNALIQETVSFFRNDPRFQERVAVETNLSINALWADVDAEQFRQVLWNLLSNAAHAIPAGRDGRITVATRSEKRPRGGEWVVVDVTDNGHGISSEDMTRIFEPFFTTREEGTGLGLPVVRRVIDGHGGELSVKSRVGEGASFTIRIDRIELEEGQKRPVSGVGRGVSAQVE